MKKISLALGFALFVSACGGGSDSVNLKRVEELQDQVETLKDAIVQTATTVEKTTTTKAASNDTTTSTTFVSESPTLNKAAKKNYKNLMKSLKN